MRSIWPTKLICYKRLWSCGWLGYLHPLKEKEKKKLPRGEICSTTFPGMNKFEDDIDAMVKCWKRIIRWLIGWQSQCCYNWPDYPLLSLARTTSEARENWLTCWVEVKCKPRGCVSSERPSVSLSWLPHSGWQYPTEWYLTHTDTHTHDSKPHL